MFHDLDETLKRLLNRSTASFAPLDAADVSFLMPREDYAPGQSTVNLYLYETHENRELRDPAPVVRRDGDRFLKSRPPLRVDCTYLVTAWSNAVDDAQVATEHQLLAQALRWLSRFPTLPADLPLGNPLLAGSLQNPAFPHPVMTARMDDGKSLGEFWSALGSPPRPAFNLVVTLAMDLEAEAELGPRVVAKGTRDGIRDDDELLAGTESSQVRQIGGIVFDADTNAPLPGIDVVLVERDARTRTDGFGRFAFRVKKAGEYTLRATGVGYQPAEKTVELPHSGANPLQAYDIELTPVP
jgi:hypothetical protein